MNWRACALILLAYAQLSCATRDEQARLEDRILFASNRGERLESGPLAGRNRVGIYWMRPDGTDPARISASDAYYEFDPEFSPDRTRIAFVAPNIEAREDYVMSIFIMAADGTGLQRMTNREEMACWPRWAPDGKRIAYCDMNIWTGKSRLLVLTPDSGQVVDFGEGAFPSWSPDGAKLSYAYAELPESNEPGARRTFSVYVLQLSGGKRKLLVDNAWMAEWSPRGDRIAYIGFPPKTNDSNGRFATELFVMKSDGSEGLRLTRTAEIEFGPRWSANGERILFGRFPVSSDGTRHDRSGELAEIYSIRPDGSDERRLTKNSSYDMIRAGSWTFLLSHP